MSLKYVPFFVYHSKCADNTEPDRVVQICYGCKSFFRMNDEIGGVSVGIVVDFQ
jgi:hypothetical protein